MRVPRQKLLALARIIGEREKISESSEINLVLTGDECVRALNKQYRHMDKTTDVLSFPLNVEENTSVIGEIYISVFRARQQALEFQHSLSTEIMRLTCHGLFHILGYDHDNDETAEAMEELERAALAEINGRQQH